MIHGDVDLTTNLDFYHDKNPAREDDDDDEHYSLLDIRNNRHLIPWKSRDKKREIREIENTSYRSISNFSYLTGPSTYWSNIIDRRMFTNYFTSTGTTSTTTYNVYDGRFRYDYSYDSGTPTVTITYDGTASNWSTISTEYNATWSSLINESNLIDTITYDLSDGINIVEEKDDEEEIEEKIPELPIFGYKTKDKNYSVIQSCWYCGRTIGKCRCKKKRIGYPDLKDRFCRAFSFNWMDSIDERRAYGYFLRSLFGRKKTKRTYEESQRSIPWLRGLNSHIYEDYMKDLYEEQDYSSYLTNMSWLRIH